MEQAGRIGVGIVVLIAAVASFAIFWLLKPPEPESTEETVLSEAFCPDCSTLAIAIDRTPSFLGATIASKYEVYLVQAGDERMLVAVANSVNRISLDWKAPRNLVISVNAMEAKILKVPEGFSIVLDNSFVSQAKKWKQKQQANK